MLNWTEVLRTNSYVKDDLVGFVRGDLTRRDLETYQPHLRVWVREKGAADARRLARKALRRRHVTV